MPRICKRGIMGLGRIGLTAGNSNGDLLLAFSNNKEVRLERNSDDAYVRTPRLDDRMMNPLFQATIEETLVGIGDQRNGRRRDDDRLQRQYSPRDPA
ncbi:MAG: P1 family peptidase [Thermomicrobiales bacterium]